MRQFRSIAPCPLPERRIDHSDLPNWNLAQAGRDSKWAAVSLIAVIEPMDFAEHCAARAGVRASHWTHAGGHEPSLTAAASGQVTITAATLEVPDRLIECR